MVGRREGKEGKERRAKRKPKKLDSARAHTPCANDV